MSEDRLILVDILDRPVGDMPKMQAHVESRLHRAFSVFLYDGNDLVIQKRAQGKYHSGGLWANTCCSHPRVGEEVTEAVCRRLQQELAVTYTPDRLIHVGEFVYRRDFGDLSEYEYDHVFLGQYDGAYIPNPEEIAELKTIDIDDLAADIQANPQAYAAWFITAFPMVYRYLKEHQV